MPKSRQFDAAASLVEEWVGAFDNVRPLSADERAGYDVRLIEQGWELDFSSDPEVGARLRILLPEFFPYARPLVAVDAEHFLIWPHVEEDGVVCAIPLSASIDPYRPVALTQYVLREALAVIKQGQAGVNLDDFRNEFYSYWDRARSDGSVPVISTLNDFNTSRTVTAWYGKKLIILGDNADAVQTWMDNRFGQTKENRSYESAALISPHEALVPAQYPRSMSDLEKIVAPLDERTKKILSRELSADKTRSMVILSAPTVNGRSLGALACSPPSTRNFYGHKTDVLQKGFRPGKMEESLRLSRYLRHSPAPARLKLKRVDQKWIHGRDRNLRSQELSLKSVAILGVGSIGSFVAELLAASGVGSLTLVDDETLRFANSSRHVLGVDSEGLYKSSAVATLLQKRFPHHAFRGLVEDGRSFLKRSLANDERYDLILSVAGDWELDCYLNDLYVERLDASPKQVLFGWSEAHAVAGHAVSLCGNTGCLLCHFGDDGLPENTVAAWKQSTMLSEPACGGSFQPYGAVEITAVNAMIASLSIESLLGKLSGNAHRIYASDALRIQEAAGQMTPWWESIRGEMPPDASLTRTLDWQKNETCRHCGAPSNAV